LLLVLIPMALLAQLAGLRALDQELAQPEVLLDLTLVLGRL
jgi:hypothetical protein